ncbi:MAG TPA: MnhB domain-containing protein [Myxococcales bacterium]|nr:MnhB domain-containing protein [Myxococcales bacterium]
MRRALLFPSLAVLAALLLWGMHGLPPFGSYPGPYGFVLNQVAVAERHATDVVSAVNFDYRAFDTMGEEFILFASVAGAALLLRREEDEEEDESDEEDREKSRAPPPTSDAVRVLGVALVGLTVAFGLYMISHGAVSPGGGFQGGVILATAPLAVYLAAEARTFQRIAPKTLTEAGEASGAAGYVLLGLAGLVLGATFLGNVLPLGRPGEVNGAGNIQALNVVVGIEIAAGFVVLLTSFIEETLRRRLRREGK